MLEQAGLHTAHVTEGLESGTDSYHDTSDSSEESPQSSKHLNIQEVPKKRTRAGLQAPPSRWKRLRTHYNDEYRQLYNETVNEIVHGPPIHCQKLLLPSQIGTTLWTSEEKETFFAALARRGRGDLPGIAMAIGTKSEAEVHVYLRLLQNAGVRQHLFNRRNQLFNVAAAPGALEVSLACSAALELSADSLGVLQQRAEAKWERKKHHDMWLLNQKLGRWATSCMCQGDQGVNEVRERLPAAELLHLENLLKLSANIFMNSSTKDENWREYCSRSEKPAILFTAFADLYRFIVSITKRLIQSSLHFAMSRCVAITTPNFAPKQAVRKQDVTAALNILGMKHNSQMFWAGVAKRCALNVYDTDDGEDVCGEPLSLLEVERRLSQGGMKDEDDGFRNRDTDDTNEAAATPSSVASSSLSEDDSDLSGNSSDRSTDSDPASRDSPPYSRAHDPNAAAGSLSQDPNDVYAEILDAKASSHEEKRLWDILEKHPPKPLNPDAIRVPRAPPGERKVGDDLDDWRAWTEYAPEWESHATPVPTTGKL